MVVQKMVLACAFRLQLRGPEDECLHRKLLCIMQKRYAKSARLGRKNYRRLFRTWGMQSQCKGIVGVTWDIYACKVFRFSGNC
jgi:hypothetical protein